MGEKFIWVIAWRSCSRRKVTDIWQTCADSYQETKNMLDEFLRRYISAHSRGYFSPIPIVELWAASEVDRVGSELGLPWAFIDETRVACKRENGTTRGYWFTKEDAERYAADPRNVSYHGDIAIGPCSQCGAWHLTPGRHTAEEE
jgi:hypothetical protein